MSNQTEKDEATLQAEIDRRQQALEPIYAERERLNAIIVAEHEAMEALRNERDLLRVARMGETVDWKYLLDTDSKVTYTERCRLLRDAGFGSGGQWTATGQAAIKFRLIKGKRGEVERVCAFVRQVLPAVTAHSDGLKWFSVMDESLSEHGAYHVKIDEANNRYILDKLRYSQPSRVFDTDTLEKLVQYLHDRVYYEEITVL